ncbi:hypothetical protein WR25_13463 [Diploscapter pachys]|uniref:Uncharacterized protein n=1 Tax=Diploscapter pachys TaxID=2018661 RepID=A0A2A2KGI2_9BILA|nr:hypothetical protein WR25_13463 [Diploscapter pachys]
MLHINALVALTGVISLLLIVVNKILYSRYRQEYYKLEQQMITLIDDYMCTFIPLDILHYICQPKVEVNENAFKKKKHLEAAKGELRYAEDVSVLVSDPRRFYTDFGPERSKSRVHHKEEKPRKRDKDKRKSKTRTKAEEHIPLQRQSRTRISSDPNLVTAVSSTRRQHHDSIRSNPPSAPTQIQTPTPTINMLYISDEDIEWIEASEWSEWSEDSNCRHRRATSTSALGKRNDIDIPEER